MHTEILIIGGGFGGVAAALRLARLLPTDRAHIRLVSEKTYLEYSAALYRVVTGRDTCETCIPYTAIFRHRPIEVLQDTIVGIDLPTQRCTGTSGSIYHYDLLILALGSATTFFGIPGVQERSFGMKTITEAIRLRRHLHDILSSDPASHIVIVGGGATGVELAGELAVYAQKVTQRHRHSTSPPITIDLVEAMPRILPTLPVPLSRKVTKRLLTLGVRLHCASRVLEEKEGSLILHTASLPSKTVIWTAGVRANALLGRIDALEVDQKGRGVVDAFLHAKGHENVFLIGDCAATPFSGMAQTALTDATYVAQSIHRILQDHPLVPYTPRSSAYAIPVGPSWAAVLWGPCRFYGRIGWWLRRLADLKVLLLYLPWRTALQTWFGGGKTLESCDVCSEEAPQSPKRSV